MTHRADWKWIVLALALFAARPAAAQFPEKFTKLKVPPKDIYVHYNLTICGRNEQIDSLTGQNNLRFFSRSETKRAGHP